LVAVNLDDMSDPDDDGWRFDPDNPPDEFTRRMLGRMNLGDLKRLSKPDNGILDEAQQASFDAAYAELMEDLSKRVQPLVDSMLPKFDFSRMLAPELTANFERIQKSIASQVDMSKALGVRVTNPQVDYTFPKFEPVTIPKIEAVRASPVAETTTADEFVEQIDASSEHLGVLRTIADLLNSQSQSAARGAVFYVVVGLATTTAGIASFLSLSDSGDRWWTAGLTAGVAVLAFVAYVSVRWWQRRTAAKPGG
jgi:hypothetical protein